jgi:four helix bundle protein
LGIVNSEKRNAGADITERTFRFAVRVARLCRGFNGRDLTMRVMVRQLLRAGTSIGANVEEAQAGHSRADFANKCSIACKEARETHYWLRLLAASDAAPQVQLADLLTECDELVAVLTAIVKKVKQPSK